VEQEVDLAEGAQSRDVVVAALSAGFAGVAVALGEADALGRRGLVFTRTAGGAGGITVYRNASLGLALAQRDETRLTGCPMGAALRAFFGLGGREAVLVPMGAPIPLFAEEVDRVAALGRLVGGGYGGGVATVAALADVPPPGLPGAFPPRDPWHGLAHIRGLPEAALVLMPDLAELVAVRPAAEAVPASTERPPEAFTVCAAPAPFAADGLARAGAPALADAAGLRLFTRLAGWAAAQVAAANPEAMVIAAPPLAAPEAGAGPADVLGTMAADPLLGSERVRAQLQLAAPWAVTSHARDLPGGAMGADGLLAGAIAGRTLAAGGWRTVAGRALPTVTGLVGEAPGLDPETVPQVTLLGRRHGGVEVLAERTADPGLYRQAQVRRLMALVLRAARHRGTAAVFEPNGRRTWRDVAMALTGILRNLHAAGALAGAREEEAFEVRCDRSTMSQQDIDLGRMIAEVRLRPAASLEMIEVVPVVRDAAGLRGAA
jgi:hypothetical protein